LLGTPDGSELGIDDKLGLKLGMFVGVKVGLCVGDRLPIT
jgi:hypothetical protein